MPPINGPVNKPMPLASSDIPKYLGLSDLYSRFIQKHSRQKQDTELIIEQSEIERLASSIKEKGSIEIEKDVRIFNQVHKEFRGEHYKPRLIKGDKFHPGIWKIVYP